MSRRAITDEQRIDAYISTAPRDALVRLQSEVNAALKYRKFDEDKQPTITILKPKIEVNPPKDAAQLPLSKGAE